MKKYNKFWGIVSFMAIAMLFGACSAPQNLEYFQDLNNGTNMKPSVYSPITLTPGDQITVIVNARDPQVAAMFNLPYYTRRIGETQSVTAANAVSTSSQNISGYTVDTNGQIDFPILGKVKVAGLKREEVASLLKEKMVASGQIKDPTVTVEFQNLGFSVMGEVTRPGRYKIDRDQFTILDAISLAGDLTINGRRENIALIRHTANGDESYRIDLTNSQALYQSPAYYVQQGDVVYVAPNDKRKRESTVNGNNVLSAPFWISVASLLTSVAVLIKK